MNFNLEYYRSFYYVAKYSSISKAAESLYVSQPSVTRSIQRLEEKMGCRLFQRMPHGMMLTSEGEVLYRHVCEAFKAFELGERKVRKRANYETGKIRIGATETPLYQYLIPKLVDFQKHFPHIHMDIVGCITSELWDDLKNGKIDVAFAVSPLPSDMDCCVYPLQKVQDIFIAGENFSFLHEKIISLKDIVRYPIAYVQNNSSAGKYLTSWFDEHGIKFKPQYTLRTSTLVLVLVQSGLSIGIVPKSIVEKSNYDNKIFEILLEEVIPPREIYLAINENFPISAICWEFVQSFLNEKQLAKLKRSGNSL